MVLRYACPFWPENESYFQCTDQRVRLRPPLPARCCAALHAEPAPHGPSPPPHLRLRPCASACAPAPPSPPSLPQLRFVNLHAFGKRGVVVAHAGPPFADGYEGRSDEQVTALLHGLLCHMFPRGGDGPATAEADAAREAGPIESVVTRWEEDLFARGSYSYLALGARRGAVRHSGPCGGTRLLPACCARLARAVVDGAGRGLPPALCFHAARGELPCAAGWRARASPLSRLQPDGPIPLRLL